MDRFAIDSGSEGEAEASMERLPWSQTHAEKFRTRSSHTGQPVDADLAAGGVAPELDELLD
jgi:hypothetical protein